MRQSTAPSFLSMLPFFLPQAECATVPSSAPSSIPSAMPRATAVAMEVPRALTPVSPASARLSSSSSDARISSSSEEYFSAQGPPPVPIWQQTRPQGQQTQQARPLWGGRQQRRQPLAFRRVPDSPRADAAAAAIAAATPIAADTANAAEVETTVYEVDWSSDSDDSEGDDSA